MPAPCSKHRPRVAQFQFPSSLPFPSLLSFPTMRSEWYQCLPRPEVIFPPEISLSPSLPSAEVILHFLPHVVLASSLESLLCCHLIVVCFRHWCKPQRSHNESISLIILPTKELSSKYLFFCLQPTLGRKTISLKKKKTHILSERAVVPVFFPCVCMYV